MVLACGYGDWPGSREGEERVASNVGVSKTYTPASRATEDLYGQHSFISWPRENLVKRV
jgi:hypothetical protein